MIAVTPAARISGRFPSARSTGLYTKKERYKERGDCKDKSFDTVLFGFEPAIPAPAYAAIATGGVTGAITAK
jgi:hypothetical protein